MSGCVGALFSPDAFDVLGCASVEFVRFGLSRVRSRPMPLGSLHVSHSLLPHARLAVGGCESQMLDGAYSACLGIPKAAQQPFLALYGG